VKSAKQLSLSASGLKTPGYNQAQLAAEKLADHIENKLSHEYSLFELLKRPELNHGIIDSLFP